MKCWPKGMKRLTASTFIAHITKKILVFQYFPNTTIGKVLYLIQVVHNRSGKAKKEKKESVQKSSWFLRNLVCVCSVRWIYVKALFYPTTRQVCVWSNSCNWKESHNADSSELNVGSRPFPESQGLARHCSHKLTLIMSQNGIRHKKQSTQNNTIQS